MADCGCNAGGMCGCWTDSRGVIFSKDGIMNHSYDNRCRYYEWWIEEHACVAGDNDGGCYCPLCWIDHV